ncbi:RluA family pseudouridine synthase [Entomospira culicis]|uniref:RNA pseudouridine synthase n=1 Tax=Entomospira culicis TaxID=2719989 RepID=A0A968GFB7_9SPIO|nr:RNA pseudouridine synthase [Entomospira culicis]NIZ18753.1 RNA pseudouridine synthase [Entomospira culicis]NIZ68968.1 RNA pseudouridine synthase [Entomospira culicis]WDI37560.1 RNA pseudouridine synthase [Entomospira culicis]WDI39188.1 RNA pseudouridine synthase [Entomospira culicis]
MNTPLLFENHEIWIFAKPAGLAVQPGKGVAYSLVEHLTSLFEQKIYPVHRLDAATQGLIIIAKRPASAYHYSQLFSHPTAIQKIYHAVVWGDAPRQMVAEEAIMVHNKSKRAKSIIQKVERWQPHASLLKIELQSGRMHQIRIHLKNQNLPIIGDTKYGNFALNRTLKSPLALYASELIIPSKNIHVQLPIKQELHQLKRAITQLNI